MATNTYLTIDMVTKEYLRILHEKLTFTSNCDMQYDSSFAKSGAKIGSSLRVRKPIQVSGRTGATMNVENATETAETITVANQYGVDLSFTSADLALSIDEFSKRFIVPSASQVASNVEQNALNEILKVSHMVGDGTNSLTWKNFLQAGAKMDQKTAPMGNRVSLVGSGTQVNIVDALKGLYQDSASIAKSYKEGSLGRTGGFDWFVNNRIPSYDLSGVSDVAGALTAATSNGATTIAVGSFGSTETIPAGAVLTIAGVYDVHPETKQSYSHLKQWTVSEAVTMSGGAGTLTLTETIYTTGARQNCSGVSGGTAVVTIVGTASTNSPQNLVFAPEAFAFVTADLPIVGGTDMCSRQEMDGLSIRLVRDYDITNDAMPMRLDILWGIKCLRPEFACRLIDKL